MIEIWDVVKVRNLAVDKNGNKNWKPGGGERPITLYHVEKSVICKLVLAFMIAAGFSWFLWIATGFSLLEKGEIPPALA